MADTKISALAAAAALDGTEVAPVVQAAATKKSTIAQIRDYIQAAFAAGSGLSVATAGGVTTFSKAVKDNVTAGAPTVNSDSSAGYSVGSFWLDTGPQTIWRAQDVTVGAAVWWPQGAKEHPGYVSGLWYGPQRGAAASAAVAADLNFAVPVFIAERVTITGLGLWVLTGVAATAVQLGLYSNANGRPGILLAQNSASASTATSATAASGTFSSSITLNPGVYWLAALFNGAPTIASVSSSDQALGTLLGGSTIDRVGSTGSQQCGVSGVATYAGGFPGSFGTATVRGNGQNNPIVCFKL